MPENISMASGAHIMVKLMRAWISARESDTPQLPVLSERARQYGLKPDTALACGSLFQLVEEQLQRPLVPECCCSLKLSQDELAIIALLQNVGKTGPVGTSRAVPHGLSAALVWAGYAVNDSLGIHSRLRADEVVDACPFKAEASERERPASVDFSA